LSGKVKESKVFPVHAIKEYRGSRRGKIPLILKLGALSVVDVIIKLFLQASIINIGKWR
jgi:hypothetical protein